MDNKNEIDAFEAMKPDDKKIISKESAEKTFNDWLDYYRIKFEHIVNDQGKEGAETLKNKIVEAIRDGIIETQISENAEEGFQIIQHTATGKAVIYNEYGYKAAREAARQKDNFSAGMALMGSLSGKGMDYFESKKNFSGPDLKLTEYIYTVFLL